jgi:ATP-dependent protease HslVU (ClpYQ) ATPase subunit
VDLPNTSGLGGRGRANQWTTYSDGRFKTNVETIDHALDKITALRGVSYVSTTETNGERQVGFIAQEVEKIVPEVVSISKTSVTMPDGSTQVVDDYRSLAYDRLVPVLTEAIRELKADNDNLRAQLKAANDNNAAQDAVLEDLRVQIEALKASR